MNRTSSDRRPLTSTLIGLALAAAASPAAADEKHWNVSTGNYSDPGNWDPFGVPVATDNVRIGARVPSALVVVDGPTEANFLDVERNSELAISSVDPFDCHAHVNLDAGSRISLNLPSAELNVQHSLEHHGTLALFGGSVVAETWYGSGLLDGYGTLSAIFGDFDGTVRAQLGTLTIGGTRITDNTRLEAQSGGTLIAPVRSNDPFSGTIDISPGGRVELTNGAIDALVPLVGTPIQAAELIADIDSLNGFVRAMSGLSRYEGRLQNGAKLLVDSAARTVGRFLADPASTVEVNGQLRLEGISEVSGGQFCGVGQIIGEPGSILRVVQDSFLNLSAGVIDLNDVFVVGDRSLTIWASKITTGDPAAQGFEGTFDNWGSVEIVTPDPWRMAGVFEFESSLLVPELHGSRMVVTNGGIVRTDGLGGNVTAPLQLLDGATVDIGTSNSVLTLNGTCFFDGGAVTGPGTLVQGGNAIVDGTVVIAPAAYDWDGTGSGSTLDVQTAGNLTVDTRLLDPRNTSIRVRGVLDVTNRTPGGDETDWFMAGMLIAHGASSVYGSEVKLDSGGVLRLAEGNASEVGFFAPLRIEDGGEVQTDLSTALNLRGPTTLNGQGATLISGDGDVIQNGPLIVESASQIVCDLYDWDGAGDQSTETTIETGASLLINVDHFETIFNQAFDGTINLEANASLVVQKPDPEWIMAGNMTLAEGSLIDGTALFNSGRIEGTTTMRTDLENAGTLAPSGPVAFDVFNFFVQTANGTLEIDIAGSVPGVDFGRIEVLPVFTSAALDGRLVVRLTAGYVPNIGDTFDVVVGNISGTFAEVDAPGFEVSYPGNQARLTFVNLCDGDVTGDGDVGFGDILAILGAWGPCPPPCAPDANGDGFVNFADILIVLGAWGPCP